MSNMLNILKSKYPEREYPSNLGKTWTSEEDDLLLKELSEDMDLNLIATKHNRTLGGIQTRRKLIAYNMYNKNLSIEDIKDKTKLTEDEIVNYIEKKQNVKRKTEKQNNTTVEIELNEMKNDIKELKKDIKNLIELIHSIYEFEDE